MSFFSFIYMRERVRVLLTLVPNQYLSDVRVRSLVFGIERVHFIYTDMKEIILPTVHEMASTMNTPPMMFAGAAIQRVHALQYTGHMNARLTAPHTDCGIEYFTGELEFFGDATNVE